MRHQFVLDKKSNRLLDELAESSVMYADQEAYLEKIEADPKFIEMMEKSAADIRAGRVSEQAEVERRFAKKRRRR